MGEAGLKVRQEAFKAVIAENNLVWRYIPATIPLEVLIVGDSVLVAFPSQVKDNPLGLGFSVTDHELANRMRAWYDGYLWESGKKP